MIVCSCNVISSQDIERALLDILARPNAPIPTPGVVFRHLSKQMQCCGCAPLTVSAIYDAVERLERDGSLCPVACASAKIKLIRLDPRHRPSAPPTDKVLPLAIAAE